MSVVEGVSLRLARAGVRVGRYVVVGLLELPQAGDMPESNYSVADSSGYTVEAEKLTVMLLSSGVGDAGRIVKLDGSRLLCCPVSAPRHFRLPRIDTATKGRKLQWR